MQSNPLDLLASNTAASDPDLLSQISSGSVASSPLASAAPLTIAQPVSTDFFNASPRSSTTFNGFFTGVAQDLVRLYAAAVDNDSRVSAIERLGNNELQKISSQLDLLQSQITAMQDLQFGYTQGYTVYNRTEFIDSSAIETDPSLIGGFTQASYDPKLQAVTLQIQTDLDQLHSSSGTTIVDPVIDLQVGYPVKAYGHYRTPRHALDKNLTSFWGEVVLTDDLVQIPWPPPNSPYKNALSYGLNPITQGTVCEYTINFRQPTSLNQIVIKPFCELPVNLAAVFCIKEDSNHLNPGEYQLSSVQTGYSHYMISEYSSSRTNGSLFLNQTKRLFFPLQQEVLSLTLVFHQPHYTREVFNLPLSANYQNSLWQQMLHNTPLLGIPTTIVSAASAKPDLGLAATQPNDLINTLGTAIGASLNGIYTQDPSNEHTYAKYQYVYGAYEIEVNDRRYNTSSVYVSKPLTSNLNLVQGTLVADADIPLVSTTTTAATAFAGNINLVPPNFSVPAATLTFDLLYGTSTQAWYPFAPLGTSQIHEPQIITAQTSVSTLRLQAKPGTPILITSFNGIGGVTVLGAVAAPNLIDSVTPTSVTWPNTILLPGYYVVTYTPMDTSHWVNFGLLAESAGVANQKNVVFSGNIIEPLRGVTLPSVPYIDSDRISADYEPNGNPQFEYVPITVSINNFPIPFPDIVDSTGHITTISNFTQDVVHTQDLYTIVSVDQEQLFSSDSNPNAAQTFRAKHSNWDTRSKYAPQLFIISPLSSPQVISQYDQFGNSVWIADYQNGVIRFVNGNAAVSGQIALSYTYKDKTFAAPVIVNRTNYVGSSEPALTPFDALAYPVIEYIQIEDRLFFNLPIPDTATVTVNYFRLFDQVRVRANFTRVDPLNDSASPHLYGYTFLARDANGTSIPVLEYPEVTWGDLEVYTLDQTIQSNPGVGVILGDANSAAGLPTQTAINWYRIINAGSVTDTLRTSYDASNGTVVWWDMTGNRFIEPDGGISRELTYRVMNPDGSNTITISPGSSVVVGIGNFLVAPGTPGAIHQANIYSGKSADFLKSSDWLITASTISKDTSIASVTIS